MAFFRDQNQRELQAQIAQAELDRQNLESQNRIEEERQRLKLARESGVEAKQTAETELKNNLLQYFQDKGMSPQEAARAASQKFAELQVTGPMAGSDTNLATSAFQRGRQAFFQGQQPFQAIAGAEDINAGIDESRARGAEAGTRSAVAAARFQTAPRLAQAQDLEGVEKATLGKTLTSAMQDRASALGQSQVERDIGQNTYQTKMLGASDPAAEAAAHNATFGAQAAEANLAKGMGGVRVNPMAIDTMSKLYPFLSSLLTNRVANPTTATPTNALPKRILTLDDLR